METVAFSVNSEPLLGSMALLSINNFFKQTGSSNECFYQLKIYISSVKKGLIFFSCDSVKPFVLVFFRIDPSLCTLC